MMYAVFETLFVVWLICFLIIPSFLCASTGARSTSPNRRWLGSRGCENGLRIKRNRWTEALPGAEWPRFFARFSIGRKGHVSSRCNRRR